MKTKMTMIVGTLGLAAAMLGQNQGSKDRMVVQDQKTGQHYEVKAPANTVEVRQTGPNSYDVKVNREAAKKIEVRAIPSPTPAKK